MPFNPRKILFTMVTGMGNGLGGAIKLSKTPTETAARSTGKAIARSELSEKEGANQVQVTDMETAETKV